MIQIRAQSTASFESYESEHSETASEFEVKKKTKKVKRKVSKADVEPQTGMEIAPMDSEAEPKTKKKKGKKRKKRVEDVIPEILEVIPPRLIPVWVPIPPPPEEEGTVI